MGLIPWEPIIILLVFKRGIDKTILVVYILLYTFKNIIYLSTWIYYDYQHYPADCIHQNHHQNDSAYLQNQPASHRSQIQTQICQIQIYCSDCLHLDQDRKIDRQIDR